MTQRLNSYFSTNRELRRLSRKAQLLLELQRQYEQVAPASLMRASRITWLEHQTLTITADNGAIAAKLRQLVPQLVNLFQASGAEVTGIQVKVQVGWRPAVRASANRSLSIASQQRLSELAGNLPDSPLRNALQRLVKVGRR